MLPTLQSSTAKSSNDSSMTYKQEYMRLCDHSSNFPQVRGKLPLQFSYQYITFPWAYLWGGEKSTPVFFFNNQHEIETKDYVCTHLQPVRPLLMALGSSQCTAPSSSSIAISGKTNLLEILGTSSLFQLSCRSYFSLTSLPKFCLGKTNTSKQPFFTHVCVIHISLFLLVL